MALPRVTSASRWHCLRHELWWAALVVLVVNDHWLKGANLLPGWLTGKLSDFAGLIVAPILLAALLGNGLSARLVAMAAVGGAFSAINLSETAASVVEYVMALLGVPWEIWCDPTDLIALPALGAAWLIQEQAERRPHGQSDTSYWFERVGALAGAISCLATSEDYVELWTAVYLENRTYFDQRVEIYRSPLLDCAVAPAAPSSLDASQFTFESCPVIEPFQKFPLDRDAWFPDSGTERPPIGPECDAVIVRAEGLEPALIFWNDVEQEIVSERSVGDPLDSRGLYLEQVGSRLVIAGMDYGPALPVAGELPPTGCVPEAP